MEILYKELNILIDKMEAETKEKYKVVENLSTSNSVYPFNKIEYIMTCLIATNTISFEKYLEMRNSYLQRNKFLYTFEMTGPRTFGEIWAQNYLREIVPELKKPSKKLDKDYSGQYDLWFDNIRIEVKASRAVRKQKGGRLFEKALLSTSKAPFNMNFQQIKPNCCDVFIWMGVWRDKIRYWILTSDELKNNKYYSNGQHRGNTGEGQLWLTEKNIHRFSEYEVSAEDILSVLKSKCKS